MLLFSFICVSGATKTFRFSATWPIHRFFYIFFISCSPLFGTLFHIIGFAISGVMLALHNLSFLEKSGKFSVSFKQPHEQPLKKEKIRDQSHIPDSCLSNSGPSFCIQKEQPVFKNTRGNKDLAGRGSFYSFYISQM